jgi:hypothetical protein
VQGKELQVAKRRVGKYPKEFRRMAVERLKTCDPFDSDEEPLRWNSRESTLRKEINQLKRVVLDKTLELDFSKVPSKK